MNLLLFLVAWILILPLTVWNLIVVYQKNGSVKGYFRSTALSIDIWANREFRTLWNAQLKTEKGYEFGREDETISSALGKNLLLGTLAEDGKKLVRILDRLDPNHCLESIKYFDNEEKQRFETLKVK